MPHTVPVAHSNDCDSDVAPDGSAHDLAAALVALGRRVRDEVRSSRDRHVDDGQVVRTEGGDDVFGIDARADALLLEGFAHIGERWPGELVMEGFDERITLGDIATAEDRTPWVFLVDPLDGTRPLLEDKRSAWVLIGAGRGAQTLEDLTVSVAVEVPTRRAALGLVAAAVDDELVMCEDDDLVSGGSVPAQLRPKADAELEHRFVTVVRFAPGFHEAIGRWTDEHLAGLTTFDDLVPCSAGQMMGLASGADVAVFDPRPTLAPGSMSAHPYDLVALGIARAVGVIIEGFPSGPLDVPIDTSTAVGWCGYANQEVADRLRPAQ